MEAYVAGSAPAFDALIARYANDLYGFLYRFVNNAALADDLVQETFLQVHAAAGSFDRSRAFKPWLYTIAANKARDQLRSRSRRQEQSLDAGNDDETPGVARQLEAPGQDALEEVERREQQQQVRELIDRMPEHLRAILILGYYKQLPYAEIAEILDIPVGTVKSRLHSAVTHFAGLWNRRQRRASAGKKR